MEQLWMIEIIMINFDVGIICLFDYGYCVVGFLDVIVFNDGDIDGFDKFVNGILVGVFSVGFGDSVSV